MNQHGVSVYGEAISVTVESVICISNRPNFIAFILYTGQSNSVKISLKLFVPLCKSNYDSTRFTYSCPKGVHVTHG